MVKAWKYLAALLTLVSAAACGGATTTTRHSISCSNACGAHATCEVVTGGPACTCDSGYTGDGQTCTPSCVPETDLGFCAGLGKNCGTVSGTDNCGLARTASCGSCSSGITCGGGGSQNVCGSAGGKESWVAVYTDYANALALIASNKASFTHVNPTFYTVNYGYQSGVAYYSTCPNNGTNFNCTGNGASPFAPSTKSFADQVAALGLVTVPVIYGGAGNNGTDAGVENILNNTSGAGDAFIAAMTAEAVSNGYGGYNLDWEVVAVDGTYADKFVAFVNSFKAALGPHGMSLSVDAIVSNINGTWCSNNSGYIDLAKLSASSIDRIVVEDYVNVLGTATTTCQNVVLSSSSPAGCDFTLTGELNMMCAPNLPVEKAVIGLEADPGATNPIAGAAFSAIRSYGFTRVAVWPQYPFMNTAGIQPSGATWYALLQDFLSH